MGDETGVKPFLTRNDGGYRLLCTFCLFMSREHFGCRKWQTYISTNIYLCKAASE